MERSRIQNHNLYGKTLKDKIFVFPYSVGSSVGAYVLYSLKKKSSGPLAIICSNRMDITTASGCAISNIPAVHLKHNNYPTGYQEQPGINRRWGKRANIDLSKLIVITNCFQFAYSC